MSFSQPHPLGGGKKAKEMDEPKGVVEAGLRSGWCTIAAFYLVLPGLYIFKFRFWSNYSNLKRPGPPNGGWGREFSLFQGKCMLVKSVIWPNNAIYIYLYIVIILCVFDRQTLYCTYSIWGDVLHNNHMISNIHNIIMIDLEKNIILYRWCRLTD